VARRDHRRRCAGAASSRVASRSRATWSVATGPRSRRRRSRTLAGSVAPRARRRGCGTGVTTRRRWPGVCVRVVVDGGCGVGRGGRVWRTRRRHPPRAVPVGSAPGAGILPEPSRSDQPWCRRCRRWPRRRRPGTGVATAGGDVGGAAGRRALLRHQVVPDATPGNKWKAAASLRCRRGPIG
jgi:hypothetical protein